MLENCSENAFCSSLPPATRKKLCEGCHRSLIKAGSIQLYRDFERHAMLILDGALMSSIHVGEDVLDYSEDVPTFYLGVPGRMLATNVTFRRREKMYYGNNGMEYLTDCCIASFEHETIRELFFSSKDFAQCMALSMIRIMEDTCEMSAILRAQSVYLSVHHFMRYLAQFDLYLTQQQIADVLNCDRASVSKAVARLRKRSPALAQRYAHNKLRRIGALDPEH